MTTTLALILNAVLAAGIVTALVLVMRTPFGLRRSLRLVSSVHVPRREENELSRAA